MWESIVNALTVAWTAVSQFFVDAWNACSAFFISVYEFLATYLGSPILAIVTLSIVGLLAILLIIFLIVAIVNPAARRKKRLAALLKRQEEYESLRKNFTEISEEINKINLEIVLTQKQADDTIFNLQEQEKTACAQDYLFLVEHHDKISVSIEKQRVLTELLKQQERGWFHDKTKAESTRQLISTFAKAQNESARAILERTNEANLRKENLVVEIQKITDECSAKREQLVAKRDKLEEQRTAIRTKLDKMTAEGAHKLTIEDAKTMIEEYDRQRKLLEQQAEDERNEAIRRAREAYEAAYRRRVQVEKDMSEIVDHVKEMQKEQAKLKSLALSEFVPVTVTTNSREDEKPDDVNIIIADVNCETVFSPEEKTEEKVEEHVYEVPEVKVVDITTIPEEDVVFIEAFLEEIDDETVLSEEDLENREPLAFEPTEAPASEEIIDEVAISVSELTAQRAEISQETATESASDDTLQEEIVDPNQEQAVEPAEKEIVETATSTETIQEPVSEIEIVAPAKKRPMGKIYDDGIPATPIRKKGKFSKPVTRIVKKATTDTPAQTEEPVKRDAHVKTGYNGKWAIAYQDGKFFARLLASNGGVMLTTPAYSSVNGVKGAIANVKDALATSNVAVSQVKSGKFVYKVLSKNNRAITQSDEYSTKYQCEKALDSAKRFAESAIIVE